MAQVPLNNVPDVAPTPTAPFDYQEVRATPDSFGGAIAQGEQKLGQGAQQVAGTFQDRFNETAADDAINQYQKRVQDITYGDPTAPVDPTDPNANKGLYALRGSDALRAGPGVVQRLNDARDQIKAGLSTDAQRLMFDEQSRRLLQYTSGEVSRHLTAQADVYAQEVNKATMLNAARASGNQYNSDDAIMHSIQDGRTGAVKSAQVSAGVSAGPEVIKSAMSQSDTLVVKSAIDGAIAQDDYGRANAILAKFGDLVDPATRAELARGLLHKGQEDQASGYVNSLFGGGDVADAIHGLESGGRANAPTSPDNAHGGWQITPATFNQYAHPGENIDNPRDNEAVGRRIIGDLSQRFGGDPARVAVGYFSGPDNVAPPGSPTPWIRDVADLHGKGTPTSAYVAGVMSRLRSQQGEGPASPAYPDESALVQKAMSDWSGNPEMQAKVMSKLMQRLSVIRLGTQTDRSDLEKSIPDIQSAALAGQDVEIPEDRIRRLLPPAEAARTVENLQIAQNAGQVFKSVQWGSQDDIAAAYKDLSSGLGPISTMIRNKTSPLGAPSAATPGSDQDSPEAYRLRTSILQQFQKQVQARNAALSTDPAGYVMSEPTVAAASQAVLQNPNDPAATAKYINASLTVQQHLGVPEDQQHIMPLAQAQQMTRKLMSVDPATGDMGQQLSGIAQEYGANWPKAFGDLVTLGKLPGEYQILAAMPDPSARTTFQRALQTMAQKGGIEKLKGDAPATAVQTIDRGLDTAIDNFRRTAAIPGLTNNVNLVSTVKNAIKAYAYFDAIQSGDGNQALQHATDAVLNDKYDFEGTMRVPKGMLPVAETATSNLVSNLKPTDLAPLAADTQATKEGPGETVEQRLNTTLDAARRGKWIPNESDTGLILAGQLRNGAMIQMRYADGRRIELPFKSMADNQSSAPAPPPMLTGVGP